MNYEWACTCLWKEVTRMISNFWMDPKDTHCNMDSQLDERGKLHQADIFLMSTSFFHGHRWDDIDTA